MKKTEVYVVTRNSRRIEEKNYSTKEEAGIRAEKLIKVLKKYKDPDLKKVEIVKTDKPYKIK